MENCFFAIPLPAQIASTCAEWITQLKHLNQTTPIKWVEPEQFHITVHFVGSITPASVETLCAVANAIARTVAPVELTLAGTLGAFPSLAEPRVLYATVAETTNSGTLTTLNQRLAAAVPSTSQRPFVPHLTLGRLGRFSSLVAPPCTPPLQLSAAAFGLYESLRENDSVRYRLISSFDLTAPHAN